MFFGHNPFIDFVQRKADTVVIHFQKYHICTTAGALKRIVPHGGEKKSAPVVKGEPETVLFVRQGLVEQLVGIAVPGVNAIITDHLKVLFRDVPDKAFDEIHGGDCLDNIFFIFVPVVMEGDSIIFFVKRIDAGCGDDRASQVSANVFQDFVGIAFPRPGINIETVFVIPVAGCLDLFEGRADFSLHLVQESRSKSIAQELVVKMLFNAPESVVSKTSFGDQTVDVRVPFQISSECMQDTYETRGEKCCFVVFVE